MKAFKKLALVSAIAAAPFAQAEMVAIDDALMGEMTGQAGITIELSTEVKIGSVVYTDTDGLDGAAANAGSLNISGVRLGGAVAGTALDGIKIDIDVDKDDGLVIHLGSPDMAGVLTGANSVDFGLDVDAVSLNTGLSNLVSNVSIQGNLGPIDVTIANSGDIDVAAYFEVTNGSLDVDVLGLGVSNLKIGQNSSPIQTDAAYQSDINNFLSYVKEVEQAPQYQGYMGLTATTDAITAAGVANGNTFVGATTDTAAVYSAVDGSLVTAATSTPITKTVVTTAAVAEVIAAPAVAATYSTTTGEELTPAVAEVIAAPAVVEVTEEQQVNAGGFTQAELVAAGELAGTAAATAGFEAQVIGGVNNMAYVGMKITTGTTGYGELNGTSTADWSKDTIAVQNALIIDITSMSMDISMDLTMGNAVNMTTGAVVDNALGSVAINDLDLSGTQLKIYGH